MQKIIVDMQNFLFADAVATAFEIRITTLRS